MNNLELAPSLLSSNFSDFKNAVELINSSGAQCIHFDVMDGRFVPPITFGAKVVKDLRPFSSLFFDVHIMVEEPVNHIEEFSKAGSDSITFHFEAARHPFVVIEQIRNNGIKAGISIIPSTPVSFLSELIPHIDTVLIMGVSPGFGGQEMLPGTIARIAEVQELKKRFNENLCIAIDGGVNNRTAKECIAAGANRLISGSAFFNAENPRDFIQNILTN